MMSNTGQSKYATVALRATTLAIGGMAPILAWETAAKEVFVNSPSSQRKGCPRSTYLGLAGGGHIVGIAPGKYTTSIENRKYAEEALSLLRQDASWASRPKLLWSQVLGSGVEKRHNSQMDVVIGLWREKKYLCQST